METFIGQIHQVRFYSNETFFIVASVTTEEQERDILMTGYMPDYSEHKTYRFEGEFIEHKSRNSFFFCISSFHISNYNFSLNKIGKTIS